MHCGSIYQNSRIVVLMGPDSQHISFLFTILYFSYHLRFSYYETFLLFMIVAMLSLLTRTNCKGKKGDKNYRPWSVETLIQLLSKSGVSKGFAFLMIRRLTFQSPNWRYKDLVHIQTLNRGFTVFCSWKVL